MNNETSGGFAVFVIAGSLFVPELMAILTGLLFVVIGIALASDHFTGKK